MNHVQDMTKGNPLKLIIIFALPLMVGNVFQQLYTVVDTIVVGQVLGVNALAAIGAVDWINWMMVAIAQGLAQGFSIQMAQDYGASDYQKLKYTLGNSIILSIITTAILLIGGQLIINSALTILNTPATIWHNSEVYLRIIYAGIPIVMAYNLLASILRALGDGKTPLYAMIAASITNIILDIIFVKYFSWGIAGAAIATLTAQVLSGVVCLNALKHIELVQLAREHFKLEMKRVIRLFYLGLPMALQNVLIGIGGILVTSVVNTFGVLFIAGYTATNKLYGILEMAAVSFGYALTTYTGQNLGAGNIKRIREGLKSAVIVSIIISVGIGLLMWWQGQWILSLFVSGESNDVAMSVGYAYEFLMIMSWFLPTLYVLHCVRCTLQGAGNTVMPMISGLAEFFMRTGAVYILPAYIGYKGVFVAEVLAWLGADVILISGYYVMIRKLEHKQDIVVE